MPKTITVYSCEICGRQFETRVSAEACESRGLPEPTVAVGDIVLSRAGFGWYNGHREWIANYDRIGEKQNGFAKPARNADHGNCFGACCTYQFYYVVTKIDRDPSNLHRWRYHLWTRAMSGDDGYTNGWTYEGGTHYYMEKVDPTSVPALVKRQAPGLIGKPAVTLL